MGKATPILKNGGRISAESIATSPFSETLSLCTTRMVMSSLPRGMRSLDELTTELVRLQLMSPQAVRQVRSALPSGSTPADLLKHLELQGTLTSFQVQKIEKGESDQLVIGNCKLLYYNAAGSFARLYRGERIANRQTVAIKILRDRWRKDPDAVQLFRREGEIGQRLKHPNIVATYDVGASGSLHYIIMEFVEGGTLKDFLKVRGRLQPTEALQYGLQLGRALEAALAQGLTHRDLKLSNVLMSSQGVAKLIDFGLATDDLPAGAKQRVQVAQAIEYSTLEKNTGAPKNDPRSDLFFLGTILFELLTGEPPYAPTKVREERREFSRYRDIPMITSVDRTIPNAVAAIVDRLLQVSPSDRYQSAAELNSDLEVAMRQSGHAEASGSASQKSTADEKVILMVEHREKSQDILRDYFNKHGYRVLLLGDPDRALARLKTLVPNGVVLFGDATGQRAIEDFQKALQVTSGQRVPVVLALGESLKTAQVQVAEPERALVLRPPVNLRELRNAIERYHKQVTV